MGTRVKVTYVAINSDGHKPIMTASTFEDLRAGLDDYYAVNRGEGECLGWYPYNTKYPDDYEGHYKYTWKNVIRNEVIIETDEIKVYCIDYHPYTTYEV